MTVCHRLQQKENKISVLDVAALARTSPGFIAVYLGNGAGGFATPTTYVIGNTSDVYQGLVADLDHDGKLDLVAGNGNDNTVSVLLRNGDGTFQTQRTFTTAGSSTGQIPNAIAVADVNRDGKPDLVVSCQTGPAAVRLKFTLCRRAAARVSPPANPAQDRTRVCPRCAWRRQSDGRFSFARSGRNNLRA